MATDMTLHFTDSFQARLEATAAREQTTVATWAAVALQDCVRASEEEADIGYCEGCSAQCSLATMSLPDEDGCRLCPTCEDEGQCIIDENMRDSMDG